MICHFTQNIVLSKCSHKYILNEVTNHPHMLVCLWEHSLSNIDSCFIVLVPNYKIQNFKFKYSKKRFIWNLLMWTMNINSIFTLNIWSNNNFLLFLLFHGIILHPTKIGYLEVDIPFSTVLAQLASMHEYIWSLSVSLKNSPFRRLHIWIFCILMSYNNKR